MVVRLSPTTLSRWYTLGCPAAWRYSRNGDSLGPTPLPLALGNAVHALLAGTLRVEEVDAPLLANALLIQHKLVEMKSVLGWTVALDRNGKPLVELKQEWRYKKNIQLVRVVDTIVSEPDGTLAVVDWKTTLGYGWKALTGSNDTLIYPQMLDFQSVVYLLPPPKRLMTTLGLTAWPKKMYYLVGPARGPVQVLEYRLEQNDKKNFDIALQQAATAIGSGWFPKIRGRHCHDCEYKYPCYDLPGWQAVYQPRSTGSDGLPQVGAS